MLDYKTAGLFNKDRKLMTKRNKDTNKLTEVMTILINEQPLQPKHEDHPLRGEYKSRATSFKIKK
jgi:mRNA interferase YafQ